MDPRLVGTPVESVRRGTSHIRKGGIEMVSASARPAVTGLYPVLEVGGRRPTLLTDFIGAAAVIVLADGQPMRLTGMGGLTANGMEFEQRDLDDPDGSGVR